MPIGRTQTCMCLLTTGLARHQVSRSTVCLPGSGFADLPLLSHQRHSCSLLYLHSYIKVLLYGQPTTSPSLPSKMPTPKLNFRVRPCFWSSQTLYTTSFHPWSTPLSRRSGSSTWPLAYLHHHQHAILCRSLPILRQNWSPRVVVPWLASGLVTGSALFLLLRISRARKVGRWRDQDPSRGVIIQGLSEEEEEKGDLNQGDTMPGSFEPAHWEPSVPLTEVVGKNLDDFLMLLCVKYKKCNFGHIITC